jgi:hypothetical protein
MGDREHFAELHAEIRRLARDKVDGLVNTARTLGKLGAQLNDTRHSDKWPEIEKAMSRLEAELAVLKEELRDAASWL